jgi:deoxyribose-phosphate aldolase
VAMRVREFAKTVDHTLLKPDAREQDIVRLCEEAARYHFAAVCVPPCYVRLAAQELRREAISGGAVELDVVMNISKFLSGEFDYVADELATLVQEVSVVAMNNGLNDVVVKVIVETAYLSDKMKRLATQIVAASGADFIKTSTGFGPAGATPEDVSVLREEAPEGLAVKASGGIRTLDDALDMLNAGASRLGMSNSVAVMKEAEGGGLQE